MSRRRLLSCCCEEGCWYRVPLCDCEPDQEPCPLFISCTIADAFFDANPAYNNHAVFELFEPSVPDNILCYDMRRDPALIVTVLPNGACELTDMPSVYPVELNVCAYCCPGCCPPCLSGPITGCQEPRCCYDLGDLATLDVSEPATHTEQFCANDGVLWKMDCPARHWNATYEVVDCDGQSVVFLQNGGDTCLAPILILHCCPEPGGWKCSCPILNQEDSCTCFCPIVDPCECVIPGPCTCGPNTCCDSCFTLGGICCLLFPPQLGGGPCGSIPTPDSDPRTCQEYISRTGTVYTIFDASSCSNCNQPAPPGFNPTHTCGCRINVFHFTGFPSCEWDPNTGLCVPP